MWRGLGSVEQFMHDYTFHPALHVLEDLGHRPTASDSPAGSAASEFSGGTAARPSAVTVDDRPGLRA